MKHIFFAVVACHFFISGAHAAAICADQCASYSSFCADSNMWCGSGGTIISPDSVHVYCMPYQGDISTPTSATWIICFDTLSPCLARNWTDGGNDKQYSAGYSCTGVNTAPRVQGGGNKWRCAAGYYSTNGDTNVAGASASAISCKACPDEDGGATVTGPVGATSASQCYIPVGTTGTNATGAWRIKNSDCNYVD